MNKLRKIPLITLATALVMATAACSEQRSPSGISRTGGMQGHDMSGMDMSSMATHCAQMRQQMAQGQPLSPDMRQMMAQCDQMDRQTNMPSGTRAR
jgi:hypothetical protein